MPILYVHTVIRAAFIPKYTTSVDIIPLTNTQLREAWLRPDEVDPHALLLEIKRQQLVFNELIHIYAMLYNACVKADLYLVARESVREILTNETDQQAKLKLIEEKRRWARAAEQDRRRGNGKSGGPHR